MVGLGANLTYNSFFRVMCGGTRMMILPEKRKKNLKENIVA